MIELFELPDDRVLVVNVLGGTTQFANQSFDALVGGDDVGVNVGDAGAETIDGIRCAICSNIVKIKYKINDQID